MTDENQTSEKRVLFLGKESGIMSVVAAISLCILVYANTANPDSPREMVNMRCEPTGFSNAIWEHWDPQHFWLLVRTWLDPDEDLRQAWATTRSPERELHIAKRHAKRSKAEARRHQALGSILRTWSSSCAEIARLKLKELGPIPIETHRDVIKRLYPRP